MSNHRTIAASLTIPEHISAALKPELLGQIRQFNQEVDTNRQELEYADLPMEISLDKAMSLDEPTLRAERTRAENWALHGLELRQRRAYLGSSRREFLTVALLQEAESALTEAEADQVGTWAKIRPTFGWLVDVVRAGRVARQLRLCRDYIAAVQDPDNVGERLACDALTDYADSLIHG